MSQLLKISLASSIAVVFFFLHNADASGPQRAIQNGQSKVKTKTGAANNVVNFNGDLIEGNVVEYRGDMIDGNAKMSPVFSQLDKDPSIDAIVFKRADFNDFHDPDKGHRLHAQPGSSH